MQPGWASKSKSTFRMGRLTLQCAKMLNKSEVVTLENDIFQIHSDISTVNLVGRNYKNQIESEFYDTGWSYSGNPLRDHLQPYCTEF